MSCVAVAAMALALPCEAAAPSYQSLNRESVIRALDSVRSATERDNDRTLAAVVAWAEQNPLDPLSLDALATVIELQPEGRNGAAARMLLVTRHLAPPRQVFERVLLPIMEQCPFGETELFLRAYLVGSPSRAIRGTACLSLASFKVALVDYAEKLRGPDTKAVAATLKPRELQALQTLDRDKCQREAAELMRRAVDQFADVRLSTDQFVGDMAEPFCYEFERLQIGMRAPDFVCADLSGVDRRLSESLGNVTVLVFWSSGCRPCLAMIDSEKRLCEELQGRPFSLVGVSFDPDRAVTRETVENQGICWPIWHDPGAARVGRKWNVRRTPTIYVLDRRGVIRFRDIRGDELREAVSALVTEAEQ